jgi:hypothetical protein
MNGMVNPDSIHELKKACSYEQRGGRNRQTILRVSSQDMDGGLIPKNRVEFSRLGVQRRLIIKVQDAWISMPQSHKDAWLQQWAGTDPSNTNARRKLQRELMAVLVRPNPPKNIVATYVSGEHHLPVGCADRQQ